jgi:methionyl-tRNA formyltransferase
MGLNASANYLVAGAKSWNRRVFDEVIARNPGHWHFISSTQELNEERLRALEPRYIFFLHWSSRVPDEIIEHYNCVCFHMTDLPYGRGGSPLQNLIDRGHQRTKLSALRMSHEIDAGPVYLKKELSLDGTAEEILLRASYLAAQMIEFIIKEDPVPVDQVGEVVLFKRRRPAESEIPKVNSLSSIYDFIRMLDGEGYPKAFLEQNGFRYEFSGARLSDDYLVANVVITPIKEKPQ